MSAISTYTDFELKTECINRKIWMMLEDYSDYDIEQEYEDRNLGDQEDCSECTTNSLISELESRGINVVDFDEGLPALFTIVDRINAGSITNSEIISYLESASGKLITGTI